MPCLALVAHEGVELDAGTLEAVLILRGTVWALLVRGQLTQLVELPFKIPLRLLRLRRALLLVAVSPLNSYLFLVCIRPVRLTQQRSPI
jgi:hypothetical protein